MIRLELDNKDREILQTLERRGAMSPSQVSATTWILPDETLSSLRKLSDAGYVLMRTDSQSADGQLVAISQEARLYLQSNQSVSPTPDDDLTQTP